MFQYLTMTSKIRIPFVLSLVMGDQEDFLCYCYLYAQTVRIFSYKLSRETLPSGVAVHFPKVKHGYKTRGARSNLFVSRSDHRSLKSIAPKVWNPLHIQLKQSPSISSFKNQSKQGLLAPYALFACALTGCRSCGNPG